MSWDAFMSVINVLAWIIIGYFTLGGVSLFLLVIRWAIMDRGWRFLGTQLRWGAVPSLWLTWPVAVAIVADSIRINWKVRRMVRRQERRYGK